MVNVNDEGDQIHEISGIVRLRSDQSSRYEFIDKRSALEFWFW